ncbi:MAG: HYR domain protein [Planctomycetes bacterium ADurb.Bin069]|nr:MAG: HYR domain protein [Planctomycetes bacterium ADurb.Bin069]
MIYTIRWSVGWRFLVEEPAGMTPMRLRLFPALCVCAAASALAEECAAVKWRGIEYYPHLAFRHRLITLKAALLDPEPGAEYVWRWDARGDGQVIREGPVVRPEAIELVTAYGDAPERYYPAKISIFKRAGGALVLVGEDIYPVLLLPETPETRAAVAIDEGLWYLHKQLLRGVENGVPSGSYEAPPFHIPDFDLVYLATALEAFGRYGGAGGPYEATARALLGGLANRAVQVFLSVQPQGNPDQNLNGYGLSIAGTPTEGAVVSTAFALAAMAHACSPGDPMPSNGRPGIDGRAVGQTAQDLADFLIFAQNDGAFSRGGWRYRANEIGAEHPASGWAGGALDLAERRLGVTVPAWCKTEARFWIAATQAPGGGFGAASANAPNVLRTASGLALLGWAGGDPSDPTRAARAQNFIAAWWCQPVVGPCVGPCVWDDNWRFNNEELLFGNPLCMYTTMRSAGAFAPPIELFGARAWRAEFAEFLTAHQPLLPNAPCPARQATANPSDPSVPHGFWPLTTLNAGDVCGEVLNTALSLNALLDGRADPSPLAILRPAFFMPVVGEPVRFDASASVALDAAGTRAPILRYEFDFGDGSLSYIEDQTSAPDGEFDGIASHVYLASALQGLTVRLTVTALVDGRVCTDTASTVLQPMPGNRPPVPVITLAAGGAAIEGDPACPACAFAVWAGYPFLVSSASSFDPDVGDAITRREWLDSAGTLLGEGVTLALTVPDVSVFALTLRVTDAGNPWTGEPAPKSAATTAEFLVERDRTPPVIELPAPRAIPCAGTAGTPPPEDWLPRAVDDLDPDPELFFELPAALPPGESLILVRARDRDGNESTAYGSITVVDTTPPEVAVEPLVLEAVSADGAPRPATWPLVIEDNCDTVFTLSDDAPDLLPLGESSVRVCVSDTSGNSTTATVSVTVVDTTPPVFTGEEELVLACEGGGTAPRPSALPVSAVDAVDGPVPFADDLPERIPLGVTEALLTARDRAGNEATMTLRVAVIDLAPPRIECPPPLALHAVGMQPAAPPEDWRARAYDDCEGEVQVAAEPAGPYPPGTTAVMWRARDSSGNEAWCEALVEVAGGAAFRRGDANDDGSVEISDAIFILTFLFARGKAPACFDAADVNDSAAGDFSGIDIADAVYLLAYLFGGGAPPADPFDACGYDLTGGTPESCRVFSSCAR